MADEKHIVWGNIDFDLADWKDMLEEEHPEAETEQQQWDIAWNTNEMYLDDERENLRKDVGGKIVVIAELGLWFGSRRGYKVLDTTNLSDCLQYDRDIEYAEWFVEGDEFRSRGIHHDGTNRYVYRALISGLDDDLLDDILYGIATNEQLLKATRSLAPDVSEVYGW